MKNIYYNLSSLFLVLMLISACEKDYDAPAPRAIPEGKIVTIAEVRAMEVPGTEIVITEDISVYGVVTMDESTGNLYKEAYMTDATGNLYLRFISSSGLYIGDSVMVNLKGAKILRYNQMLQVDSLHPDNNIVKIATQVFKTPETITIDDLFSNLEAAQGKLVQIDNSWFQAGGQGLTYAYAATQTSESRILQDLGSTSTIEVRTSGYANFANDTIPAGAGSFIGIVAQYNSGLQLLIRDPNELSLNGVLPQMIIKNFQDQSITSGGWTTQVVIGTIDWSTSDQGQSGDFYGVMSNYIPPNVSAEAWLISPSLDFSASTSPVFDFRNAYNYSGTALEVLISTNYDGVSAPATATWAPLSVKLSSGGFGWVNASDSPNGPIDLTPYLVNNVYIGFKYTGSSTDGSTWEVDDIEITY